MSECTKCNEYDKEKHYCPKWCEVIKNTLEDVRADEKTRMLEPYNVKSIEELIQNVKNEIIQNLADFLFNECGIYYDNNTNSDNKEAMYRCWDIDKWIERMKGKTENV